MTRVYVPRSKNGGHAHRRACAPRCVLPSLRSLHQRLIVAVGWAKARLFALCPPFTHTAVILRCSPFFTASLEGWATGARSHPSRRAQERAPQDDEGVCAALQEWWARTSARMRAPMRFALPTIISPAPHRSRRVGKGASLRAVPTIHTHRRHPEVLAVLHGEPRRMGHRRPQPSFETRARARSTG